jgi:hypothetical protein
VTGAVSGDAVVIFDIRKRATGKTRAGRPPAPDETTNGLTQDRPGQLSPASWPLSAHWPQDIPALWAAAATTDADRKALRRTAVEQV